MVVVKFLFRIANLSWALLLSAGAVADDHLYAAANDWHQLVVKIRFRLGRPRGQDVLVKGIKKANTKPAQ